MTEYYLVDVKSISSDQPRSSFNENDLDKLARSILDSGILLKPLVLKQIGPESYDVINGHFEYYGAVRAKEINPRSGEMVSAFIISPKDSNKITEQTSILSSFSSQKSSPTQHLIPNTDLRVLNLESRLDRAISDIKEETKKEFLRLNNELISLKAQIPPKIEPFEIFNNSGEVEITLKLSTASIKGKTAQKIIASILKERKKKEFHSFADIVNRVERLGDKRMLTILDAWNGKF